MFHQSSLIETSICWVLPIFGQIVLISNISCMYITLHIVYVMDYIYTHICLLYPQYGWFDTATISVGKTTHLWLSSCLLLVSEKLFLSPALCGLKSEKKHATKRSITLLIIAGCISNDPVVCGLPTACSMGYTSCGWGSLISSLVPYLIENI